MTKLFNNKLFIALFALFMTVCALLGITATLPRPAKAATAETNAITADSIKDISEYSKKVIGWNTDISGKLIYWEQPGDTSGSLSGWTLEFPEDVCYFNGSFMHNTTTVTLDNPSALVTKEQYTEAGKLMGLFIYTTGEVVTFNDGAYSFDPKNGLSPEGCSIDGEAKCILSELEERTDTSNAVESEYEGPVAGKYIRVKSSSEITGTVELFLGATTVVSITKGDIVCYWGESVDVMERIEGVNVVNRGTDYLDLYFEEDYTFSTGIDGWDESYSIYELSGVKTPDKEPNEEPSEDKGGFLEDVQDWFNNAGDDVAEWLGDNTGIAITGGGVLTIGAIIIIIIALRKRR